MENGHANENGHGVTNGDSNTVHMDYSTDFPSLPVNVGYGQSSSNESAWIRPKAVVSKNSTLTFTLTPAERSNKLKPAFPNQTTEEAKRCNQIAVATGCRIELSESKDGALTVIIQGPRHKVEDARAQVVRGLQTQDKEQISIPKDHHRKLIGKEGAALKQLEADTNCNIMIPKRDNPSDVIEIKGPAEGIRRALAHIREVSQKEASQAVEHIVCPRILIPFVRGPFNENYDKLVNDHGVKINIPPSHVSNEVINVSGPREGVAYAAQIIRKIVAENQKAANISIQVAKSQHRYIIGQQRKGLHEILRETGVWVEVPNEEENSDNIILRGNANKLNEALVLVLQRASSIITQKIECPVWLHRHLIGQKGQRLTELVPNRTKVQIDFDEGGNIFLEGSPEEVKLAFTALDTEVTHLIKTMAIEKIKVHPDLHRHLIGRGGSLISKIKDESKVQISIPDGKLNSDEITIEGEKSGVQKAVKEIKAIVSKHENEKSKDLIVEQHLHKLLIGSKGAEIAKIRQTYPNVSLSFPDVNKKSDVINIRGDKNEVDAVATMLTKKVKELKESNYQEFVTVFKDCHKIIIGKGGANIRKIRDETQTRIDLPDGNSLDEKITVTGKKENVKKAVEALNKIQNEQANVVTVAMEIPVKVQSRLLGGGRRLIQNMEEECGGVHIKFPAEKSESTKVTIRGPKEDVERAETLLSALVKDKEQNYVEDTVKAKPDFHRFLIGKGGSKINKIRENYDVRIMFPREADEDKETIHLLGKKEDVAHVKKELEDTVLQLNETVEETLEIEPDHHKHFLKGGAALLKEIQSLNGGVIISFPRSGDANPSTVTIKGIKQGVEAAKARMEEEVEDLTHHVKEKITEIPHKDHGALLANGGAKINEIKNKYNVKIFIPKKEAKNDVIEVEGRDTKVEAARQAILAIAPIERSIDVPAESHGAIIGQGWTNVHQIQAAHNVYISIPKRDSQNSSWTIKGASADVEAALDDIRQRLADLAMQNFVLEIEVPADYHQRFVGFRGDARNELHSKFQVDVTVPHVVPGVRTEDKITLKGYEEKVHQCAEHIKSIVEYLNSLYAQEVSLDSRFHSKLESRWGKKQAEKFGVEVLIARNENDPNLVIIAGKDEEKVFDAIDAFKEEEENWLESNAHRERPRAQRAFEPVAPSRGPSNVVIANAPWEMNAADFPEMGPAAPAQTVGGAWGASRRW